MANTKISGLSSGNPAQSGDLLPIDRPGANFSVTAQSVANQVAVLANGVVATTQAPLDASTKVATDAYADAAVAVETSRATTAEALLAPKASPALTGTPTAPTASALDNSTKIGTTAYTDAAVAVETSRAEAAETLLAPLASPALTGTPTAPTKAAFSNNTDIASAAYVDNNFKGVSVSGFREDFIANMGGSSTVTTVVVNEYDTNWAVAQISAGSQVITSADASFANPGQIIITTSATSGQGMGLFRGGPAGRGVFGALGSNAGWEFNAIFKLSQTTNCAVRMGLMKGGQEVTDPPSDGMYVEYDTANTGNTSTDFTWVTRSAGTPNYSTVNAIAADTNFHHFRIRSLVAGTILFSVDGGTETSIATDVSTANMTVVLQILTRTSGTAACTLDFISFIMTPTRT